MRRKILLSTVRVFGAVAIIVLAVGGCVSQPTFRKNVASAESVDPARLREHVVMLSETLHPRDWKHVENLEKCADYIVSQFTEAGATVESQVFEVRGQRYRNVIGRFGVGQGNKLVLGAHYDAHGDSPGADDNASGVAALIELAHLIGEEAPQRELELVAYTLEEPPFFRTPLMGSVRHAESLVGEDITGVIVLEMVGCFNDERGTQRYPSRLLKLIYPSRGNFIAVVGRWDQGDWVKAVKARMKGATDLPVYSIRAPIGLQGIDFSDHRNYWPHGLQAVMVTDTAFYRNRAYHSAEDTEEKLDYERMADVVIAVLAAVRSL